MALGKVVLCQVFSTGHSAKLSFAECLLFAVWFLVCPLANAAFAECPMECTRQTSRHSAIGGFPVVRHLLETHVIFHNHCKDPFIIGQLPSDYRTSRLIKAETGYWNNKGNNILVVLYFIACSSPIEEDLYVLFSDEPFALSSPFYVSYFSGWLYSLQCEYQNIIARTMVLQNLSILSHTSAHHLLHSTC